MLKTVNIVTVLFINMRRGWTIIMSRSRKKPISGIFCCESDKPPKVKANRKLRRLQKRALKMRKEILPSLKEVSNVWVFGKGGKTDWTGTKYEKEARRK